MKFLPKRIWAQVSLAMVVLVSLSLLAMGALLIQTSREAVRTSVLRDHEQLAIRAASELSEFIERPKALLTTTAAILGTLHADRWKQETVLVELALNQDIFGRIAMLDTNGQELATSELGTNLLDRSREQVVLTALKGTLAMSEVVLSEDHLPMMTMAIPVRRFGEVTGALYTQVNLRDMWDIVDHIRMGKTGNAFLVSGRGILIAHPDKKRVLKHEAREFVHSIEQVLSGKTGSMEEMGAEGAAWLCSYAPIPGLDWGIVVKQATQETYLFSQEMQFESWLFILISALLAILVSIVIAKKLVRPIRLLINEAGQVAQGNLDVSLELSRKDEIGDLIQSFNQMTEKLKKARDSEKHAAMGKASAAIAHELKNSLTMTYTCVGLLPERRRSEAFLDKFLNVVPQELDHCRSMLQDLSDFARQSQYEMQLIDMKSLLNNFISLANERLAQKKMLLETHIPSILSKVNGNEHRLKQIFMNIVLNAVDAMTAGGKVILTVTAHTGHVHGVTKPMEIEIKDTGRGIAPDQLKYIFEPFHTTKQNGLGLGLAICQEIARRHGGDITVASWPGKGTAFKVYLPIIP